MAGQSVLALLSAELRSIGYRIFVFTVSGQERDVQVMTKTLLDCQVDGVIAASVSVSDHPVSRCADYRIPVVMFNRGQNNPLLSEVTSDNFAGAERATRHPIETAHKRIGHLMGWQGSWTGRDRAMGFSAAMAQADLQPIAVVDGMYLRAEAERESRHLFTSSNRPDAIFVASDHMAFAVMDVLRFEIGLRVPKDVSIVGFDDVPMAAWWRAPRFTGHVG